MTPTRVATAVFLATAIALPLAAHSAGGDSSSVMPRGLEMIRRTERGFAKATGEIGIRNGFSMFFTDDCIAPPDSTPVRARLLARPAPIEPRVTTLVWEPLYGDIARSVDLGYLTGPSSYQDAEGKTQHIVYFSVWRRQLDGLWRVVLDAGMDQPSLAPEFANGTFRAAPDPAWSDSLSPAAAAGATAELRQVDTAFLAALGKDAKQAYAAALAEHPRVHRDGQHPLLDRAAILAWAATQPRMLSAHVIKADASAAGDFGWTFGACEYMKEGKLQHAGYTHVWKRDARGHWRIVADLLNAVTAP